MKLSALALSTVEASKMGKEEFLCATFFCFEKKALLITVWTSLASAIRIPLVLIHYNIFSWTHVCLAPTAVYRAVTGRSGARRWGVSFLGALSGRTKKTL